MKTNLEDKKANEAKRAKEDAAVDKVIENAQMDIPEAMLRHSASRCLMISAEECSPRDYPWISTSSSQA